MTRLHYPPLDHRRVAAALAGQSIGGSLEYRESTGSTNDDARELAIKGWPHGTVVIAEEQQAGRGRRGATWFAPPRQGLLFSVILRPTEFRLELPQWARLTHCAAWAVADALERLPSATPLRPQVKWPNDVYLSDKKVAGLLLESVFMADQPSYAILGIGINVYQNPQDLPKELREIATAIEPELAAAHPPMIQAAPAASPGITREEALLAVLRSLAKILPMASTGFDAVLTALDQRSWLRGHQIHAQLPTMSIEGQALGLTSEGALLVRAASGETHELTMVERIRRRS